MTMNRLLPNVGSKNDGNGDQNASKRLHAQFSSLGKWVYITVPNHIVGVTLPERAW